MRRASDVVPVKVTLPATTTQELVFHMFQTDMSLPLKQMPFYPIWTLPLFILTFSSTSRLRLLNMSSSNFAPPLRLGAVSRGFFSLPTEDKQKYSRTFDLSEGYGNDIVSEDQPINWNDRLQLKIHPADQRNIKLWPDIVPDFRETLDKYSIELKRVLETLLKAIAKALNLEENIFLNQYGEDGSFFARFNYYPPCPHPDQVAGLKPHSDSTVMTILMQDKGVEGLQVLRDDQWYKVPVIPDALVVNVGDQLEILSNGMLKSSIHKAMTSKEKARISVATQSTIHPDKEFGPLSELIDMETPKLYKNVTNYFATFFHSYARGERAIETVKIQQLKI